MKRLKFLYLAVALLMCLSSPVYAAGSFDSALGTDVRDVDPGDLQDEERIYYYLDLARDDIVLLEAGAVAIHNYEMEYSIGDFVINDGTVCFPLSSSSTPKLQVNNAIPSIVWVDGITSPVSVTVSVPTGYISGGTLELYCDQSIVTTPCKVDYSIYVNRDNLVMDSAALAHAPIALATATAGYMEVVTLTASTETASLVAGDSLTYIAWRDDTETTTNVAQLEFYKARFKCVVDQ